MPIASTSKATVDVRADTVVKAELAQLGNSKPQIKISQGSEYPAQLLNCRSADANQITTD